MGDPVTPQLRVQLLGPFQVAVGDCVVSDRAWRSQRASALVKLLALAPHYRLHRDQIMEALWPDLDPDDQANNLNVAASRARQALATAGAPRGVFVIRTGEALVLGPLDVIDVDVARLEDAIALAWQRDDLTAFRDALAGVSGELLPDDLYEDWIADRRALLRTSHLAVLVRYGHHATVAGAIDEAIAAYQRLLVVDPVHEEGHLALMRLYARVGQRSRALEQFDQLVLALDRELGVTPDPAAIDLADAIRAGRYPGPEERATTSPPVASSFDIPMPLDELIGRQQEIAEVQQGLTMSRLVTLTGPGGVGKTRLALAVASEVRTSFPDGIAFVDLSAIRDPESVLSAITQSLDVREVSGRPTLGGIADHLAGRRMLVILDNFEQVVEAGPVVSGLLERAPLLRGLVTSRVPLRVRGEAEYPVAGLGLPEPELTGRNSASRDVPAIALFLQRARGSKPSFAVTPDNEQAIGEICRRLDGLPLAIELAAARIKVLTPVAMLTRLDRPLALLVDGPRDLPFRQQTIRETIAWSHDLLSPPEQRLLWRLSVFAGGWSLAAAEQVVGGDSLGITVLDGIASLVDKNLVYQRDIGNGDLRFGMLETIREYAAERLTAAGEETVLRDRHAAAIVALAERTQPLLERSELVDALAELDREDGNLREVLRWVRSRGDAERALRLVVALRTYWFIRGRLVEACETTLAVAMSSVDDDLAELRLDALNCAGYFAREYGNYELAQQIGTEGLAESRRLNDRKREGDALANLSYVALQRGDLDEANALLRDSLDAQRALQNQQGIADALSMLALIAFASGDYATARSLDDECLTIWDALGDLQAVAWIRVRLGEVMLRQGQLDAAYTELITALTMARDLGFWWGFSWAFDGLAQLAAARGDFSLAATLAIEAESVRHDVGLRLTPTEQDEIDRLRATLERELGIEAFPATRTRRGTQEIDSLIQVVRAQLGDHG